MTFRSVLRAVTTKSPSVRLLPKPKRNYPSLRYYFPALAPYIPNISRAVAWTDSTERSKSATLLAVSNLRSATAAALCLLTSPRDRILFADATVLVVDSKPIQETTMDEKQEMIDTIEIADLGTITEETAGANSSPELVGTTVSPGP